jgi:hypothetical protein
LALLDTVTEPAIAVEGELDASNWFQPSRPFRVPWTHAQRADGVIE